MSSSSQQASQGLSAPLFQGTHVSANRESINEITVDSLDQIIGKLDELANLWEDYRGSSIRTAKEAQQKLNTVFEIGLGWKIQRDDFRTQFSGSTQQFTERIETDKIFHTRMAEMCAAEAMLSVCYKFIDALATLLDEEDGNNGAEISNTAREAIFKFAGTVDTSADFGLQFVNQKVLPWIESHGQDALSSPNLEDIEHLRVSFWDSFKSENDNQDRCSGPGHKLGSEPWHCATCVLHIVLGKYNIPRPTIGRLSENRQSNIDDEDSDDDEDAFQTFGNLSVTTQQLAPIVPAVLPPAPAPTTVVAPVAPAIALVTAQTAQVAQVAQAPAAGQFKPTYLQIRANGHNGLVQTQAPMTPAAILSRSVNLPDHQKDSRLTFVGGMRYLCCHGPPNNKCGCFFQCRPDLAKHGRVDHGVHQFPAADWAQIGPYNIDEMRILRPGKTFALRSARDPVHMR